MRVLIPSPLLSYTGGKTELELEGARLEDVLAGLEERFPGIRHRMIDEQDRVRPHIWFFVGGRLARDITQPIRPGESVQIVCALSGG